VEALTWTAFLNVANTLLIVLAGFLAREAWKNIHVRLDAVEDQQGSMRERIAVVETASDIPRRRRTDSGPHRRME
jgi:hypothetical protein